MPSFPEKHREVSRSLPTPQDVVAESAAGGGAQREHATALALRRSDAYSDEILRQVQIVQAQIAKLCEGESRCQEQQEYGAVAQTIPAVLKRLQECQELNCAQSAAIWLCGGQGPGRLEACAPACLGPLQEMTQRLHVAVDRVLAQPLAEHPRVPSRHVARRGLD